jgi:hypothetical protein
MSEQTGGYCLALDSPYKLSMQATHMPSGMWASMGQAMPAAADFRVRKFRWWGFDRQRVI